MCHLNRSPRALLTARLPTDPGILGILTHPMLDLIMGRCIVWILLIFQLMMMANQCCRTLRTLEVLAQAVDRAGLSLRVPPLRVPLRHGD